MIYLSETSAGLPRQLLDIHERGELVFFTGAGISAPAGPPTFWPLVNTLWNELIGLPRQASVDADMNGGFLDRVVQHIDLNSIYGRAGVRKLVAKQVENLKPKAVELTVHKDLLKLSGTSAANSRIVTTNYDRLFSDASNELGWIDDKAPKNFVPPAMPVPKRNWSGHVYIHGKVEAKDVAEANDDLIISSGDFGRAYLTEQWAANFLRDLIANHSICFIGYSLNDPILRYVADAIAADRGAGEKTREMFAFVGFDEATEMISEVEDEWDQKGITPVFYPNKENPTNSNKHWVLNETIRAWAEMATDTGYRNSVIENNAGITPTLEGDSEAARKTRLVLWALDEPTGRVAQTFAKLEECPKLDWLKVMSDSEDPEHNLFLQNRLDKAANRHALLEHSENATGWFDNIQRGLFEWVKRLLPQREMVVWLAEKGNVYQRNLRYEIRNAIKFGKLEKDVQDGYSLMLHGFLSNHATRGHDVESFRFIDANLPENFKIEQFYKELHYKFVIRIKNEKLKGIVTEQGRYWDTISPEVWELETDAVTFLNRITSIWVRNLELVEKFETLSGKPNGFRWNLRSIGDIKRASPDHRSENRLLNIKMALEKLLATDQDSAKSIISRWIILQYRDLFQLAIWGMSKLDLVDSKMLLSALAMKIDERTVLLDPTGRGEVVDLLHSKGNLLNSSAKTKKDFEDILFKSKLGYLREPTGDNKDEYKNDLRYSRLQAALKGGYEPSKMAADFITKIEKEKKYIRERTIAANSNPSASLGAVEDVPESQIFNLTNPETWKKSLIEYPVGDYDNWSTAASQNTIAAFNALVEASEKDSTLLHSRWLTFFHMWTPPDDSTVLKAHVNRLLELVKSKPLVFRKSLERWFRDFTGALSPYFQLYFDSLSSITRVDYDNQNGRGELLPYGVSDIHLIYKTAIEICKLDHSFIPQLKKVIKSELSYCYTSTNEELAALIERALLSQWSWCFKNLQFIARSVLPTGAIKVLQEVPVNEFGSFLPSALPLRILNELYKNRSVLYPRMIEGESERIASMMALHAYWRYPKSKTLQVAIRNAFTEIGVLALQPLASELYSIVLTAGANIKYERAIKSIHFVKNCFPKTRVSYNPEVTSHILAFAVEAPSAFERVVNELWDFFAPISSDLRYDVSYLVLTQLQAGSLPEESSDTVLRVLNGLFLDSYWKSDVKYSDIEVRALDALSKK